MLLVSLIALFLVGGLLGLRALKVLRRPEHPKGVYLTGGMAFSLMLLGALTVPNIVFP